MTAKCSILIQLGNYFWGTIYPKRNGKCETAGLKSVCLCVCSFVSNSNCRMTCRSHYPNWCDTSVSIPRSTIFHPFKERKDQTQIYQALFIKPYKQLHYLGLAKVLVTHKTRKLTSRQDGSKAYHNMQPSLKPRFSGCPLSTAPLPFNCSCSKDNTNCLGCAIILN